MTDLRTIADRHGLKIIERRLTRTGPVGAENRVVRPGDISVFGLQGDKLAPGGEDGVFLYDDERFSNVPCAWVT